MEQASSLSRTRVELVSSKQALNLSIALIGNTMSTARQYSPHYTVEDYQLWKGDWELWHGIPVAMTLTPFGKHSRLLVSVASALKVAITANECDATVLAEIDWNVSDDMVLRPDVIVVCGSEPERHLQRAPAVVVEVLSHATRDRDLRFKRAVYAEQAVPWYLIIDPDEDQLTVLQLDSSENYVSQQPTATLELSICQHCSIQLSVAALFD